ncbi:hypothetical protein NC651_029794 [Populus alba x Populus x berolinensis]|nr:hypothetical protein NC651_029794 [Populus alba x Populus x berolinensis]
MAVDIILSAVLPFVELAIGSITTNICNAFYCKSNLRHLKEEVDKLKNARERMQHLVDEDRRKGKVIEEDVAKWLLEVDGITEKVERELAQDEGGVKKKCFMGLCPNFKTRYQLGKKAEEKLATVKAKLEEQRRFVSISYQVAPSGVESNGRQRLHSRLVEIQHGLRSDEVELKWQYKDSLESHAEIWLHEKIYHGTLKTPSFGKLQMLEVKHCDKLKNLFSFSIARGLLLLQSIKITCCRNLEEIVVEESEELDNKNEEINSMELTQVRSLSLKYLPNLRNFCSKEKASCLYQTQSKSRTTGMDFGEIILEDEPHAPMQLFDEKTFVSEFSSTNLTTRNGAREVNLEENFYNAMQPLFDEKVISTLEELSLSGENPTTSIIWCCQLPEKYYSAVAFPNMKKLRVEWNDVMEDDGAAQSELLSIPKESTLAREAKADGKASSAVSERRASENLHLTGTSEARKDICPVFETLPRIKQNRIKGVLLEPKIAQLASRYQDFHAASNDKDSRQGQSSSTPMDSKAQISLQEQTDSQAPDNDETSLANAIPTISVQQSYRVLVSRATSVEQVSMLTSTSLTNRTSSQELTFDTASSSNTPSGYLKSCGVSFEIYRCSIDLLKELLMKSPAEVATSADRLLLLSSLKNLKNCPFLNYQQQKIIQLYAENFNTLVTSHPFDAQKIDWTSSIKSSIEDHKRRLAELDISDEDMTSKISRLKAEKDALNKRLQEIQEEEDHFRRNKERLHAQRIIRNGRLEIQIGALLEAQRHGRETKGRASHS